MRAKLFKNKCLLPIFTAWVFGHLKMMQCSCYVMIIRNLGLS